MYKKKRLRKNCLTNLEILSVERRFINCFPFLNIYCREINKLRIFLGTTCKEAILCSIIFLINSLADATDISSRLAIIGLMCHESLSTCAHKVFYLIERENKFPFRMRFYAEAANNSFRRILVQLFL